MRVYTDVNAEYRGGTVNEIRDGKVRYEDDDAEYHIDVDLYPYDDGTLAIQITGSSELNIIPRAANRILVERRQE